MRQVAIGLEDSADPAASPNRGVGAVGSVPSNAGSGPELGPQTGRRSLASDWRTAQGAGDAEHPGKPPLLKTQLR